MRFALALLAMAVPLWPASQHLTLEQARRMALEKNRALKIARLKVEENGHQRLAARSDYFPKVLTDSNYLYFTQKLGTTIHPGDLGLGILPPPLPSIPIPINLVKQNLLFGGVTLAQPVTQSYKIRAGVSAAASDEQAARARVAKAEDELLFAVEQLYLGLRVAGRQTAAAEAKVAAAEEQLNDAKNSVETGTALRVVQIARRAALLEGRQSLLALRNQAADYAEALAVLLGLAPGTELELADPGPSPAPAASLEDAIAIALRNSPEIQEAEQTIEKARAGVRAARAEYIPDLTLIGQYFYQTGMPALPGNFRAAGARASFTLFDFAKRREQVRQRRSQLEQAEENLLRVREKVENDARKAYRAVEQSEHMIQVAREAEDLRTESERLTRDQFELGFALKSAYLESQAARASASADLARADAGWRIALAELRQTIGVR